MSVFSSSPSVASSACASGGAVGADGGGAGGGGTPPASLSPMLTREERGGVGTTSSRRECRVGRAGATRGRGGGVPAPGVPMPTSVALRAALTGSSFRGTAGGCRPGVAATTGTPAGRGTRPPKRVGRGADGAPNEVGVTCGGGLSVDEGVVLLRPSCGTGDCSA